MIRPIPTHKSPSDDRYRQNLFCGVGDETCSRYVGPANLASGVGVAEQHQPPVPTAVPSRPAAGVARDDPPHSRPPIATH